MTYIGDFVNPTWVNDTTKLNAANLQAMTDKIKEMDNELDSSRSFNWHWLRDYLYFKNQKIIDYSTSGWTIEAGTSTTVSNDTTYFRMFTNAIRSTYTSAAEGWTWLNKTVSVNCLTSEGGDTLTTDDYLIVLFYIYDINAVDIVQFWLQDGTNDSYVAYSTGSFGLGWNCLAIKLSSLVNYSAVNYSAITRISYRVHYKAGYANSFSTIQYMGICRKHPVDTSVPDFAQTYNGSSWTPLNSSFTNYIGALILDGTGDSFPSPNLMLFHSNIDAYAFQLDSNYWKSFYAKAYFRLKKDGKSCGVCWYIDSNNYINCYLNNSTVYVFKRVSGSNTTYTKVLGGTPTKDSTLLMSISKTNGIFRCIFWLTAYSTKILEFADPFPDSYAKLHLSYPNTDSYSYLRDFVISNKQSIQLTSGSSVI